MSLGQRAYDLLRGYVNTEWDRIHRAEDDDPAAKELAESLTQPSPLKSSTVKSTSLIEGTGPSTQSTPEERNDLARRILGVSGDAGFSDVRHAYERINRRADPANFPENSPEARQAAQIQKRVQWAFAVLGETFDCTEKRFQSLEIE